MAGPGGSMGPRRLTAKLARAATLTSGMRTECARGVNGGRRWTDHGWHWRCHVAAQPRVQPRRAKSDEKRDSLPTAANPDCLTGSALRTPGPEQSQTKFLGTPLPPQSALGQASWRAQSPEPCGCRHNLGMYDIFGASAPGPSPPKNWSPDSHRGNRPFI